MARSLSIHFLPRPELAAELAGASAVVIDVLRASTTIVCALAAGAREVLPCLTVEEARRTAAGLPADQAVLGGERGGVRIAGFDLGNSPAEYTPAAVGGRSVVFTTTNGTRALLACRGARHVLIAAFVNVTTVAEALGEAESIHVVCAGTNDRLTRDDVLLAGLLWDRLSAAGPIELANDEGRLAADAWSCVVARGRPLAEELADSRGGRNLVRLGMRADIDLAAETDRFNLVPRLDPVAPRIAAGAGA